VHIGNEEATGAVQFGGHRSDTLMSIFRTHYTYLYSIGVDFSQVDESNKASLNLNVNSFFG
jgi:hypothetical protein